MAKRKNSSCPWASKRKRKKIRYLANKRRKKAIEEENLKKQTEIWENLPPDLLLHIVSIPTRNYPSTQPYICMEYNAMVIVASRVCRSWRYALTSGITALCFDWFLQFKAGNLIRSVVPKFKNLRALTLSFEREKDDQSAAIETIARCCPDLRELNIYSISLTKTSMRALARGCPRLMDLTLDCNFLSVSGLTRLLRCCTDVRSLSMGSTSAAMTSDWLLRTVSSHCSRLKCLQLFQCDNVTDDGVKSLVDHCPNLEGVTLSYADRITDESVMALARGCPRLVSLDLSYCKNITDRALYALAERGPRHRGWLRRDCADDDGNGRREIKYCRELQKLTFYKCGALTPGGVKAVVDAFPGLHTENCLQRKEATLKSDFTFSKDLRCACSAPPSIA